MNIREEALKLADWLDKLARTPNVRSPIQEASIMIREQARRIEELETVLQSIANEHLELSHDKIKWQVEDHIRWAKDVLNHE